MELLTAFLCLQVSKVRVCDKSHPGSSHLNQVHMAAFDRKDIVQYVQCDLSKDVGVEKAFNGDKFNFVVNLCGETRFGLRFVQTDNLANKYFFLLFCTSPAEYKTKSVDPAQKCAAAALRHGVSKFVEVSTAQVRHSHYPVPQSYSSFYVWLSPQVYESDDSPSTEGGGIDPWTTQAFHRLEAERSAH